MCRMVVVVECVSNGGGARRRVMLIVGGGEMIRLYTRYAREKLCRSVSFVTVVPVYFHVFFPVVVG